MPAFLAVVLFYHLILVALLVAATFIDYDLMIIPDEITVTGMVLGLALGTLFPEIRPDPSTATTHCGGLLGRGRRARSSGGADLVGPLPRHRWPCGARRWASAT